jgi:hypothetical protein
LTFWINGGTTTNRQIQVQALINDNAQAAVTLANYTTVTAGTWQQVTIPLADLHANNQSLTGFWLQDSAGTSQPAFYVDDLSLTGVPVPSQVNLLINASQKITTVDSRVFGVNAAVWDGQFNSPTTTSLLSVDGTKVLRFPGGSLSYTYHWQTGKTDDGNSWATSFDSFAQIAKGLQAQAYITLNYGSGSSQEAADWLTYSNITKGYGFKYWELGNENYGSWENDSHNHDPYTYAQQFKTYQAQLKGIDPTIKLGAVVVTGEDSYANNTNHPATNPRTGIIHNGWTPVLLSTLKSLGVTPDFIIYHKYNQEPGTEGDAGLLASTGSWKTDAQDLRQQLTDYLGSSGATVELDCTEHNSVSYNPGKQTTSLVNGLFFADSLGQLLQTEFKSLVWWDLRNSQEYGNNNSSSLYGWRNYGDYGTLDPNNSSPYPTYYIRKLLTTFAKGGDQVVSATSDYGLLSVYASRRRDGSLRLLVINKSPTNALTGKFTLSGFTPKASAQVFRYGVTQDNNAKTGSGSPDVSQGSFNAAGPNFSYQFPAYSATVFKLVP